MTSVPLDRRWLRPQYSVRRCLTIVQKVLTLKQVKIMNKSITLIVSPKGETKIETNGFTGASCCDASKFLESALGTQATEKLKSEYFIDTFNTTGQQEKNQC